MAVMHIRARVDEEGKLVVPASGLPAGTEVDVAIEVAESSALEARIAEEDAAYWSMAKLNLDFWDNGVDDAVWNSA